MITTKNTYDPNETFIVLQYPEKLRIMSDNGETLKIITSRPEVINQIANTVIVESREVV